MEEEQIGSPKYPEFPWESQYHYKCRVFKIQEYNEALGELRATALANVWANYHFLGKKIYQIFPHFFKLAC